MLPLGKSSSNCMAIFNDLKIKVKKKSNKSSFLSINRQTNKYIKPTKLCSDRSERFRTVNGSLQTGNCPLVLRSTDGFKVSQIQLFNRNDFFL